MTTTGDKLMAAEAVYALVCLIDDYDGRFVALVELSILLDISFESILIDFNDYERKRT